jgi:hypothetical protein
MASYTMQLREYIEMWSQEEEDKPIRDIIETGRPQLFNFDYPLFTLIIKKTLKLSLSEISILVKSGLKRKKVLNST